MNNSGGGGRTVVFCTYQSLEKVSEAQKKRYAPAFDLTICDEAHRTCGLSKKDKVKAFQGIHHDDVVRCTKRLYMTATPRLYTRNSK